MPSTLSNPLRLGLRQERVIPPQCLIIFGASGDLTHRKLIPVSYTHLTLPTICSV